MSPRSPKDTAAERRFLIAPDADGTPRLAEEELHHALHVVRLGAGDRLIGLDGRGGLHPLVVTRASRRELVLERDGEQREEPAPGAPGSPLPRIAVAVALPKGPRADATLGRLTQLGAAAIVVLATERTPAPARDPSRARRAKLERVCREACKQCGRAWFPEILGPWSFAELVERARGGPAILCDPEAPRTVAEWHPEGVGESATWTLAVGPEGGLTEAEREAWRAAGLATGRLGPWVLRIETAAEAGLAVLVQRFVARGTRPSARG